VGYRKSHAGAVHQKVFYAKHNQNSYQLLYYSDS